MRAILPQFRISMHETRPSFRRTRFGSRVEETAPYSPPGPIKALTVSTSFGMSTE